MPSGPDCGTRHGEKGERSGKGSRRQASAVAVGQPASGCNFRRAQAWRRSLMRREEENSGNDCRVLDSHGGGRGRLANQAADTMSTLNHEASGTWTQKCCGGEETRGGYYWACLLPESTWNIPRRPCRSTMARDSMNVQFIPMRRVWGAAGAANVRRRVSWPLSESTAVKLVCYQVTDPGTSRFISTRRQDKIAAMGKFVSCLSIPNQLSKRLDINCPWMNGHRGVTRLQHAGSMVSSKQGP